MIFSFDPNLTRPLDRVRFGVGDINEAAPLLDDDTYQALLDTAGGNEAVTIRTAAARLIVRYGHEPDRVVLAGDGGSLQWSDRLKVWREIAGDVTGTGTSSGPDRKSVV